MSGLEEWFFGLLVPPQIAAMEDATNSGGGDGCRECVGDVFGGIWYCGEAASLDLADQVTFGGGGNEAWVTPLAIFFVVFKAG